MGDLILGAAECIYCAQPVKGYFTEDMNEADFAHVDRPPYAHRAFGDPETFQVLPAEVWHAIAVDGA